MSLFALVQVAIATIFIYLILSLVASEIQEQVAAVLELRARTLKQSIQIVLGEKDLPVEAGLTGAIYRSSCMEAVNQYAERILRNFIFPGKRASVGPSYIERETFVGALLEALQTALQEEGAGTSSKAIADEEPWLSAEAKIAGAGEATLIAKLMQLKGRYPQASKRLVAIAQAAALKKTGATLADFRQELGTVFDRSQARISGVYKRNAKSLSFTIGLLLAMSLNVDGIHIVETLGRDPGLATKLANLAGEIEIIGVEQCLAEKTFSECQTEARALLDTAKSDLQAAEIELQDLIDVNPLQGLNPARILGWILSAIAISMGAPFWFDLLGRFLKVRNAGKVLDSRAIES